MIQNDEISIVTSAMISTADRDVSMTFTPSMENIIVLNV